MSEPQYIDERIGQTIKTVPELPERRPAGEPVGDRGLFEFWKKRQAKASAADLVAIATAYRRLPDPDRRHQIRLDSGCTLHAFGEALGVATLTILRWEKGVRPRANIVAAYVDLLERLETLRD